MSTMLEITRKERIDKALAFAKELLSETANETTAEEKKKMKLFAEMMKEKENISFLTELSDVSFRSKNDAKTVSLVMHLIDKFSIPKFLPPDVRLGMILFQHFGKNFPHVFVKKLKKKIWNTMQPFFRGPKEKGVRLNLNHLGEAILGEKEATKRFGLYLHDLNDPEVEQISIKVTALYSQISLIGWEETLKILKERFRQLLRGPKFVSLDMEEYKDLDLTIALFVEVLSEKEFEKTEAGIVLQSYLPDSFEKQKNLTAWAKKRGVPIKLRIVKGANLAMEKVESSMRGWPQAPFEEKIETDANFLRMLEFGMQKENAAAVHIGVGTHNLFDISYALILREENGVEKEVSFEMLQGMAEPMRRALQKRTGDILVYTPEVNEEEFPYAAPYLIRRLDENTAPDNFLRHLFDLENAWDEQSQFFQDSAKRVESLTYASRRRMQISKSDTFTNECDTDFSLEENRRWAASIYENWKDAEIEELPPQMNLEPIFERARIWDVTVEERSQVLAEVAKIFRERRGNLIGAMLATGSKVFEEADTEVSEAIDFIEYYRREAEEVFNSSHLTFEPKGLLLVTPPWNFPVSIPVSGIAAALLGGNAVLFKPAPETAYLGKMVATAFWEGGVPREVLQFVHCEEEITGNALIADERINGIILTGATSTAKHFLRQHPGLDLMAETGGKNAMIIGTLADRDLAIADLIKSAFGHAGQKCSACSLAILEADVYDDPKFLSQLADAATSLITATSWNAAAKVPPLIREPDPAIFALDEGESWLVEPQPLGEHLYSPGIKLGVKPNSRTHQTEFFAPILGVMRAENLEHAIELANGTPYGLTSGLHSLDEREHRIWEKKIKSGNLYINRTITGAIVQRQPFGGTKASSFGPGAKAGGPNYIFQMTKIAQKSLPKAEAPLPQSLIPIIEILPQFLSPEEIDLWKKSLGNYAYWAAKLKEPKDPSKVLGQSNNFYHVPHEKITLRLRADDSKLDIFRVIAACLICGTPLEISAEKQLFKHPDLTWRIEERKNFLSRVEHGHCSRIRLLHTPSRQLQEKAAEGFSYIASQPVLASGRIELLHYMREVVLSKNTHRYGYIPEEKLLNSRA